MKQNFVQEGQRKSHHRKKARERCNNKMLKRNRENKAVLKWNHMARASDKWLPCKVGGFSYSESPRTPPLEGTSLHRRNKSVERPWGILSLFTTCSDYEWIHLSRGCDTDIYIYMYVASLWSRSFFLRWITADPSPLGNFTPPMTIDLVWRDPGGSWACLRPVSNYEWIHLSTYLCVCVWHPSEAGSFSYSESPQTPPL